MRPGAGAACADKELAREDATRLHPGVDGSEMITSYSRRRAAGAKRPSPTIRRVRGSWSASWFSSTNAREASTPRVDFRYDGALDGCSARPPEGDAAAEADDVDGVRVSCSSSGQVAEQLLRQHVGALDASTLPSMASGGDANQPAKETFRRALPVIRKGHRFARGFEVPAGKRRREPIPAVARRA